MHLISCTVLLVVESYVFIKMSFCFCHKWRNKEAHHVPWFRKMLCYSHCKNVIWAAFIKRKANAFSLNATVGVRSTITKWFFFNISKSIRTANFNIYHDVILASLLVWLVGRKSHKHQIGIIFGSWFLNNVATYFKKVYNFWKVWFKCFIYFALQKPIAFLLPDPENVAQVHQPSSMDFSNGCFSISPKSAEACRLIIRSCSIR